MGGALKGRLPESIVCDIMVAYLYASYWQCPCCKIPSCSLHSMFSLLEQHRSELTAGVHEVGVLCIACSQVNLHRKLDLNRTPDTLVRRESNPARRVFLIELKCAKQTCSSPVPILAATGSSTHKGDFAQLQWTFDGSVQCRKGHGPELPPKILAEHLLWSDDESLTTSDVISETRESPAEASSLGSEPNTVTATRSIPRDPALQNLVGFERRGGD